MKRDQPPTEAERRRLVERVMEIRTGYGLSAGEACQRYGVPKRLFYRWARELGINLVGRDRPSGPGSGLGSGTGPPDAVEDQDQDQDQDQDDTLEIGLRRALRRFAIDRVDWLDDDPEPEPEPIPEPIPEPEPEPAGALVLVAVGAGADEETGGSTDE